MNDASPGSEWIAPGSATPVQRGWLAAGLVVAVFLAYQPAWHGGFVWDDNLHLLNNPVLAPGGVFRIWLPGTHVNYWPATSTVYWLEYQLWGLNPTGFHLVNIGLHALSAILVWRVLAALNLPGAPLAAALFALHPVNVESVAWITQLKNVFSLALTLASVLLYLRHERQGGRGAYVAAIAMFTLATLAKGMTLTLPVVLLALAWWQRGRIDRRDLFRVMPLVLIGLAMVGIEVFQQHLAAADDVVRHDGFLSRAAVAGCAVWFYLWKLIWPANLMFVYPRWDLNAVNAWWFLPGLALVGLVVAAWTRRSSWGRPFLMLLVCYVTLLLPILGFVNVYFMEYSLVADHWQYAAMIVPCAVLAGIATTFWQRRRWNVAAGRALIAMLLATLFALTWQQSRMYADGETLFRMTLERNPRCAMAYNNLGNQWAAEGRVEEAIALYRKALDAQPDLAVAHSNLGGALIRAGRLRDAAEQFRAAIGLRPRFAPAYLGLANALAAEGRVAEAVPCFEKALAIWPDYPEAHNNFGDALTKLGRTQEALRHLDRAIALRPDYAEAHLNLGNVWAAEGRLDRAAAELRKALELRPDYVEAQCNLASVLASSGRFEEALVAARRALQLASEQNRTALANVLRAKAAEYEAMSRKSSGRPDRGR